MVARSDEIAQLIVQEMGKPLAADWSSGAAHLTDKG
jgi:hypothetical protein